MTIHLLTVAIGGLSIVAIFIYRLLSTSVHFFRNQNISTPRKLPFFGTWWGAWNKFQGEEDLKNVQSFGKIHGTCDGLTPNVVVVDPDIIKALFVKEGRKFRNRRAFSTKHRIVHKSLLELADEGSNSVKNALASLFPSNKLRRLVPRVLQTTEAFTQNLIKKSEIDPKIDISRELTSFLNNTLALSVLGVDLQSSADLEQQFNKFSSQLFVNENQDSTLALIPLLCGSKTPFNSFVANKEALNYFVKLIQTTLEERQSREDPQVERKVADFVDLLLEAVEEEKQLIVKKKFSGVEEEFVLSNEVLTSQCLAVILNALLATNNAVALSIHALATHTQVQERLHAELSKQIHAHSELSYEMVQNCEYLDMFFSEILRLYPADFRLEKECIEETCLENLKVDKGVVVSVPLFALHRIEEFYPDPEEFYPERFSPENTEKRTPYTYLPHGQAGLSSSNISVQFGVLLAKLVISSLVKNAKFTPCDETKNTPVFEKGLTGVARPEAIFVNVEPRK